MENERILSAWEKSLSEYNKLKYKDAQELYKKAESEENPKLKKQYMDELVTGTLYVVAQLIRSRGLIYLNSPAYDMNDIIASCTEVWIKKLYSGDLLKHNSYSANIHYFSYADVFESMGLTDYSEEVRRLVSSDLFVNLFLEYFNLKKGNPDITAIDFYNYIKDKEEYYNFTRRCNIHMEGKTIVDLFEAIINSFEQDIEGINLKTYKLEAIRKMIISNGFEYMRDRLEDIEVKSVEEEFFKTFDEGEMQVIILDSHLKIREKEILIKYYGLFGEERKTIPELAKEYNVSKPRVQQIIARGMRILIHRSHSRDALSQLYSKDVL